MLASIEMALAVQLVDRSHILRTRVRVRSLWLPGSLFNYNILSMTSSNKHRHNRIYKHPKLTEEHTKKIKCIEEKAHGSYCREKCDQITYWPPRLTKIYWSSSSQKWGTWWWVQKKYNFFLKKQIKLSNICVVYSKSVIFVHKKGIPYPEKTYFEINLTTFCQTNIIHISSLIRVKLN